MAATVGRSGGVASKNVTNIRPILITFVAAFAFGIFSTYVLVNHSDVRRQFDAERQTKIDLSDPYGHVPVDHDNRVSQEELKHFESHTHERQLGQDAIADTLYDDVRILCWILTSPQNLQKKTIHLRATWTRRCNKVLFISSEENPDFPTVKIDTPEGRDYLWRKTRGAFQYIYEHHLQDADWFLKADDDTYTIVENLRYMLADKDTNKPVYFGRRFKPFIKQGYMSGGAGYILSKKAVTLLVEKGFTNPQICRSIATAKGAMEDVEMGKCLDRVGVLAGDSRDELQRDRFHPFVPSHHLVPGILPKKFWYWDYVFYPTSTGPECCSDYSISFHYIGPNDMYLLEYMIYHMRPFGIGHYACPANMNTILDHLKATEDQRKEVKGQVEGQENVKQEGDSMLKIMT